MIKHESNRFLESLTRENREYLLARSRHVKLTTHQRLSEAGANPEFAYIMLSGFASEVVQLADGELIEIGLVGSEGLTGTYHLLGPSSSLSHCFIQMSGTAYRLPFPELEDLFVNSADVRNGVLKYVQHQIAHLGQTAACNRVHDAEPRFARWLLTVHDRTRIDEFSLTQEFLAQMLGTGRSTISVIARSFEKAGLVGHRRGKIRILDRMGLQALACACYEATRGMLVRLYA